MFLLFLWKFYEAKSDGTTEAFEVDWDGTFVWFHGYSETKVQSKGFQDFGRDQFLFSSKVCGSVDCLVSMGDLLGLLYSLSILHLLLLIVFVRQ